MTARSDFGQIGQQSLTTSWSRDAQGLLEVIAAGACQPLLGRVRTSVREGYLISGLQHVFRPW